MNIPKTVSDYLQHWWDEELDDLKTKSIEAQQV